jgi:hypothetical protein
VPYLLEAWNRLQPLQWCLRHRDQACAMGRAGRAAVLDNFTLDHYEQRQIAIYRSLAGRQEGATPAAIPVSR